MIDTTNPILARIAEQLESLGVYCVCDDHHSLGVRQGHLPTGIHIACNDTVDAFDAKLSEPAVQEIIKKHGWIERYDGETAFLWVENH
jgi:hypothetical protein